eukprot:9062094-Pyramimonas_sp.AAC.1
MVETCRSHTGPMYARTDGSTFHWRSQPLAPRHRRVLTPEPPGLRLRAEGSTAGLAGPHY